MKEWKSVKYLLVVALIAVGLGGCIGPVTEPDFVSPTFNGSEIDTIYMLPALEFASYPAPYLDRCIRKGTEHHFRIKEYRCVWLQDKSLVDGIKRDDILKANPTMLVNMKPPEARWFLLFALLESHQPETFITRSSGEIVPTYISVFDLFAYLFDRSKGELIWSNKEKLGEVITHDGVLFAAARIMNGLPYK